MFSRRRFIRGAALAAVGGAVPGILARRLGAQEVPNSSGSAAPRVKAPPLSCDCHVHIFDAARFPQDPHPPRVSPTHATVADYRLLQKRDGTSRVVVVTPRNYALDNRVTLDALSQFGPDARGVAVVTPSVADGELRSFAACGVRGIRFSIGDPATAVVSSDMIEPLARRIADLGWHIQFLMKPDQIVALAGLFRRLPTSLVFDHMGTPPVAGALAHPSHRVIRGLLDAGRTWVKLSAAYSNSLAGPPDYPETVALARDFIRAAPERLVWGSDWPHTGSPDGSKPDDTLLFDLLGSWAPDEATRRRILVLNPEALYGFPAAAG